MWSLNVTSGETDWKVLAINVNDPLAEHLNGKPVLHMLGQVTVYIYPTVPVECNAGSCTRISQRSVNMVK